MCAAPFPRSVTLARPAPRRRSAMFPLAQQILGAESDLDRVGLVLRIPDAILVAKGRILREACMSAGFRMGCQYLELRETALHANRDKNGQMPERFQRSLEIWRAGFVALLGERQ